MRILRGSSEFAGRELMMNAVGSNPEDGTTFKSEGRTDGQKILNPLRSPVTTMREEPMIAHPDAQAPGYPPKPNCKEQCFPGKKE